MFPVGTDFLRFSGEACSIDEKLSVTEIVEMSTMLLLYALQGVVGGVAVIGVFGGARTGFVVVSKDILSSERFRTVFYWCRLLPFRMCVSLI